MKGSSDRFRFEAADAILASPDLSVPTAPALAADGGDLLRKNAGITTRLRGGAGWGETQQVDDFDDCAPSRAGGGNVGRDPHRVAECSLADRQAWVGWVARRTDGRLALGSACPGIAGRFRGRVAG